MKFTRKKLLFSLLAFALVFISAYAVSAQTLNTGLSFGNAIGLSNQDIRLTIAKIIRIILGFLGIISVGLVMYAGFIWMTAGGNEEKIGQAKTILKNAAIGLAVILASFGIVSFIIGKLLEATSGNGNTSGSGPNGSSGVSGLGNGIVKSVYPEPFQKDVPRNTAIIVTFREPMKASSLCTTVTSQGLCAPDAKLVANSVKIYKTSDGSGANNITNASAASSDNMTFVFKPAGPNYLGIPTGPTDYTVALSGGVQKADGSSAFNLSDFRWPFQVNNTLDLTSPKILSVREKIPGLLEGGIFPLMDNGKDTVSGTSPAVPSKGTITVNGKPAIFQSADATIERLLPPGLKETGASVTGTNRCAGGPIDITIVNGTPLKASVAYSQPGLEGGNLAIVGNRIELAPCGLSVAFNAGYNAGNSWRITVVSERQADTLKVGSKIYTFVSNAVNDSQISVGATNNATAANIAAAMDVHPEMTATVRQNIVTVQAKVAGSGGNNLELTTSNQVALALSRMTGGSDQSIQYTVVDRPDQPKNAVIQLNFNEPINPLTIAGDSVAIAEKLRVVNSEPTAKAAGGTCDSDSDCRSYKCSGSLCQGDQLAGKFVVSNQYKTAEFISDIKCGVNGCGENIYCLPANSHLQIEAAAAALMPCSTNADCTVAPFSTCAQGVCTDTAGKKNYPVAASMNGIIDAANNSLDGNRNNNPQGQADTWDENKTSTDNAGRGDNYRWSFWVSDRLDLTPPEIISTSVNNKQSKVSLSAAIDIVFSKLMLSSSLTTGNVVVNNGLGDVTHKLINLWSLASNPVGYWVQKKDLDVDPVDGRPDRTDAVLGHGTFGDSTSYAAQVGSGVKDIYQNCYKPSAGPSCRPNALMPSCCRDANGDLQPTATLNSDGNCQ